MHRSKLFILVRFSRSFLSALLLTLLAFAAQPIPPAYAWAMDCSNAANLAAMQVDQAQCESLESIYDNLGGTGWTNNTGWGTPTDVDTWEGVTRVGGNVTEIGLGNNNLTGDIGLVDLTGLSGLEDLNLSNNQIGGNINGLNLSGLSSLTVLSLYNNQIGGAVDGLNLSGLSSLTVLGLHNNQIGGNIDGLNLTGLTNLYGLSLNNNQIGGNIDGLNLTGLTDLRALDLYDNQIGGNIDGLNLSGLTSLGTVYLFNNQIGGNIDGFVLSGIGLTTLREVSLRNNQIGGDIAGLDLTGLNILRSVDLSENQIGGDPSGITSFPTSLIYFSLQNNQLNGTVPDLTGTIILSGWLQLCPNLAINPTGTTAIDNYAETHDSTGWTAAAGCGSVNLVTTAACNGNNLDVTITTGDLLFDITGTGPTLPQNGVGIGTTTLTGPGSWTGVTITEMGAYGDNQSANLGDFDCPVPNLAATTACNGDDLNITVTAGDANFDISADDPAAANQAQNNVALGGPYTLVSSGGGGQWTNITITELGGDTETLNLPDTTCPPPAAASSSSGGGSAPSAQASASCITIDVEADREVVAIGDPVKWTLAVRNSCTNMVDNVVVSGQLPGSLTPLDLTTSRGEINRPLPDFEVQLGTMQPQEIAEMWIDSRVAAGAGLVLPEGAAGQTAGQTICLTGLVTGDSDTDCVSLFPDTLPSTGGEPVKTWGWWWLTAGILAVGGGLWAIRQRTSIC